MQGELTFPEPHCVSGVGLRRSKCIPQQIFTLNLRGANHCSHSMDEETQAERFLFAQDHTMNKKKIQQGCNSRCNSLPIASFFFYHFSFSKSDSMSDATDAKSAKINKINKVSGLWSQGANTLERGRDTQKMR